MLINSHMHLASCLYKGLLKTHNIKLNLGNFQAGSVIPDLLPDKRNSSHHMPDSFDFVLTRIKRIRENTDNNIDKISYQLGVVTHFLADYFCFAHNDDALRKNLWKHFKYELALHRTLTSVHFIENKRIDLDVENIEDWLIQQHANYLKTNSGVVSDILYIQKICYSVCLSLVTSLELTKEKIA